MEALAGPQSTQALASRIFGLYSGFVYFTPMLGGLIADRWIGQRNAVVIGALLMTGGHLAMAFEQSLLLALMLLVTGSGFLKGNISAQVGSLYRRDDEARRTRGFTIFSTGINIGAVTGPFVCGALAQVYGWHYGFGVAALFMLVGLATYLYGYRYLPARVASDQRPTGKLTAREWYTTLAVIAVIAITVFQSISQYQEFNVFPVWMQQHVALQVGGHTIPDPVVLLAGSADFHLGGAAAHRAVAMAGVAPQGTGRSLEDRNWREHRGGEQLDSGGGDCRLGRRARSPDMAGFILRGDWYFLHVLLAHDASAGVARRAG